MTFSSIKNDLMGLSNQQGVASSTDLSVRVTLEGLVSARWVLLLLFIFLGGLGEVVPSLGINPVRWSGAQSNPSAIFATILFWGGSNIVVWYKRNALAAHGNCVAGLHLIIDIIVITVLLGLTGGAANPFTVLFVVPITLATQVAPRWTWGVAIASVVAFGILLEVAPFDAGMHSMVDHAAVRHAGHEMLSINIAKPNGGNHYADHLRGMWFSLGITGALITFFVHRIALRITKQRNELSRLRDTARQDQELARIGSLAAGAAHELGTPLATLSVLLGELKYMSEAEKQEARETMREELARCKYIIASMASSELRAEALGQQDIEAWALSSLDKEFAEALSCVWQAETEAIAFVPKALILSILRELVANAAAASGGKSDGIKIRGSKEPEGLRLEVTDTGAGMSEESLEIASNPFYSTKEKPENMGLGLFLARSQIRAHGGDFFIESTLGQGTRVQIFIPDKE